MARAYCWTIRRSGAKLEKAHRACLDNGESNASCDPCLISPFVSGDADTLEDLQDANENGYLADILESAVLRNRVQRALGQSEERAAPTAEKIPERDVLLEPQPTATTKQPTVQLPPSKGFHYFLSCVFQIYRTNSLRLPDGLCVCHQAIRSSTPSSAATGT